MQILKRELIIMSFFVKLACYSPKHHAWLYIFYKGLAVMITYLLQIV